MINITANTAIIRALLRWVRRSFRNWEPDRPRLPLMK